MYNLPTSALDSGGESDNSPESRKKCWNSRLTGTEVHLYRMADQSDEDSDCSEDLGRSDLKNVREKIQKLEREKAKLERKNAERHLLEQKYRELNKSVSALKSGNSGEGTSKKNRSPVDKNRAHGSSSEVPSSSMLGSGIANMLNEQRAKLDRLTNNRGDSGSTHREADEGQPSESDDDEESKNPDIKMSKEHRQKLQEYRHTLVESIIPDDIFNDLIANQVLPNTDVSRIKEKSTREAMNEELLDNLIRRSDRAFYVFVRSLRKTLQGYLADLIDEPPPKLPRKTKRKRKTAELNISVDCEDVVPVAKKKPACSCQEVEEQILAMARTAYHTIRRRDNTPASFEQFKKELSQTNDIIKDTMEIMHTLKILCKHGDEISNVSYGSVKFTLQCISVGSAKRLWEMYRSGALLDMLQQGLITKTLLKKCRAKSVKLRVRIPEEEYIQCIKDLSMNDGQPENPPTPEKKLIMTRSPTRVLRSFMKGTGSVTNASTCQDAYGCRTRHAFKEIQRNLSAYGDPKAMVAECEKVTSLTPRKRLLFNTRLRSGVPYR